jgi:molybdate transport system regulatory protein
VTTGKTTSLKGKLTLLNKGEESFTNPQIQLLAAIDDCGSISAAAKQAGISYKTAWDRINTMNNMSEQPLVLRAAGGARGGGTTLTSFGRQIVVGFQAMQEEHDAFVAEMDDRLDSVKDVAKFIQRNRLRSSARNQYRGKVVKILPGAVNSEVELQISKQVSLIALITNDSLEQLLLKQGDEAIALIKSSWVLLSKDIGIKTSARNQLQGTIAKIMEGAVNSEVILNLDDHKSICAVITRTSVDELELQEGDQACALCKASSVILLKD